MPAAGVRVGAEEPMPDPRSATEVQVPVSQQVRLMEEQILKLAQQVQTDQTVIEQLYKRIRALESALAQKVLVAAKEAKEDEGGDGSGNTPS